MSVFRCSRCGYDTDNMAVLQNHLCKIEKCPAQTVRRTTNAQGGGAGATSSSARGGRKKQLRPFGQENRDYIRRDFLKQNCVSDPLKGVQTVVKELYFHPGHAENHNIRRAGSENNNDGADEADGVIEVYNGDAWVRRPKTQVYNKMIYMACDMLEYNIPRKYWSDEFEKFLHGMNDLNNDVLLEFIREEIDETIAEKSEQQNLDPSQ